MFDQLMGRQVHVIRVHKSREVAIDQVQEREEHGQSRHVGIAVVIRAIDQHRADKRGNKPGSIEGCIVEAAHAAYARAFRVDFEEYIQAQADERHHGHLQDEHDRDGYRIGEGHQPKEEAYLDNDKRYGGLVVADPSDDAWRYKIAEYAHSRGCHIYEAQGPFIREEREEARVRIDRDDAVEREDKADDRDGVDDVRAGDGARGHVTYHYSK